MLTENKKKKIYIKDNISQEHDRKEQTNLSHMNKPLPGHIKAH